MKKRQIIVNRKFQISIAVSFATVSAVTMTIIIVILSTVLISNNIKLEEINKNQKVLSGTQDEIFKTLLGLSESKNLRNFHISASMIQNDNNKTKLLFNQNIEKIKNITESNNSLIMMLIFSAIIQTILFFYLMLKRSHRISGPIFLLNRYIHDMKNGGFPEIRPLRTDDDFHDLFDNFRDLADMIREKNMEKVESEDEN
jgi:hypothetical protein